ncbi:L,D-transpeptidase family protein [Parasphingorhabdus sp.]|uniref:L,D-transpeptidase family protein n=1 Tax=Parasphingorhabdus sp. TaxID=2709688 RepID=UPI002F953CE9
MSWNKQDMRYFIVLFTVFFISPAALAQSDDYFFWSDKQLDDLQEIVDSLPSQGLGHCNIADFSTPNSSSEPMRRSRDATLAANQLIQAHLLGCSSNSDRLYWHIEDDDKLMEMQPLLMLALITDQVKPFFNALQPYNPNYGQLRDAYAKEEDPGKRRILAENMERWRWMPMYLGRKYLMVNIASFEVSMWEDDQKIETWPVIVGKQQTKSPVFEASVSGVVLNPWWEIPASIVAESVGSMLRNRPAEARRRGYVIQNGRYRQRPGPGNSLGQMKLVMPNPYSVYLHDTPSKSLFANPVRTYSHGCIRVGGAIDFAKFLLNDVATAEEVDDILTSRETTTVSMNESIPIYITYFTAEGADDGSIRYLPDVYRRDSNEIAQSEARTDCPA